MFTWCRFMCVWSEYAGPQSAASQSWSAHSSSEQVPRGHCSEAAKARVARTVRTACAQVGHRWAQRVCEHCTFWPQGFLSCAGCVRTHRVLVVLAAETIARLLAASLAQEDRPQKAACHFSSPLSPVFAAGGSILCLCRVWWVLCTRCRSPHSLPHLASFLPRWLLMPMPPAACTEAEAEAQQPRSRLASAKKGLVRAQEDVTSRFPARGGRLRASAASTRHASPSEATMSPRGAGEGGL